jgi:hypothetical protein
MSKQETEQGNPAVKNRRVNSVVKTTADEEATEDGVISFTMVLSWTYQEESKEGDGDSVFDDLLEEGDYYAMEEEEEVCKSPFLLFCCRCSVSRTKERRMHLPVAKDEPNA